MAGATVRRNVLNPLFTWLHTPTVTICTLIGHVSREHFRLFTKDENLISTAFQDPPSSTWYLYRQSSKIYVFTEGRLLKIRPNSKTRKETLPGPISEVKVNVKSLVNLPSIPLKFSLTWSILTYLRLPIAFLEKNWRSIMEPEQPRTTTSSYSSRKVMWSSLTTASTIKATEGYTN